MATQIRGLYWHHDHVSDPHLDRPVAAGTHIAAAGLIRLDPPDLHRGILSRVASPLTDDQGRSVWLVTWGHLYRSDWEAVLVKAYDPEDAVRVAAEALPDRLRPQQAVLASEPVARAVLAGERPPAAPQLRVID